MTVLSQAAIDAARELQEVRQKSAQLEKRADELKKYIYSEIGDSPTAIGMLASGVSVVHVVPGLRSSVNTDKLQAMYPEVYAAVLEEKPTKTLKVDL